MAPRQNKRKLQDANLQDLSTSITTVFSDFEAQRGLLAAEKKSVKDLSREVVELQAVRARLQGDKDGLQADNAKLYADNDALRSEKDDLQDEKGDLQFNLATEQGRVQSLEAQLGAMEDELQDTLFAHEGSSLQLQRKNVEVLTANNKNRDLEAAVKAHDAYMLPRLQRLGKVEEDLLRVQGELNDIKEKFMCQICCKDVRSQSSSICLSPGCQQLLCEACMVKDLEIGKCSFCRKKELQLTVNLELEA